jgi:hypothetical protein
MMTSGVLTTDNTLPLRYRYARQTYYLMVHKTDCRLSCCRDYINVKREQSALMCVRII